MARLLYDFFEQLLGRSRHQAEAAPEPVADEPPDRRRQPRESVSETALLEWLDDRNRDRAEPAHVLDRSPNGMELELAEPLLPGWPLLVTPAHELPIKAIVRHARQTPEGPRVGVMLIHHERRRYDRFPCDWTASMDWQVETAGEEHRQEMRIRDAAQGGVRAKIERPVQESAVVRISHEGWHRFGTVVDCRPVGDFYEVGVQFVGPPRPDAGLEYYD